MRSAPYPQQSRANLQYVHEDAAVTVRRDAAPAGRVSITPCDGIPAGIARSAEVGRACRASCQYVTAAVMVSVFPKLVAQA
jgi:hypothetical protein